LKNCSSRDCFIKQLPLVYVPKTNQLDPVKNLGESGATRVNASVEEAEVPSGGQAFGGEEVQVA
jgi:hypothetical protein